MVAPTHGYVSDAIENHIGRGRWQYMYVFALCLTYGMTPIHTYSNMFASTETTWHRSCSAAQVGAASCAEVPLVSPANCSVPLEEWEVDTVGRSTVGDFKLVCDRHREIPELGSLYFLGYAIGVLACGTISDIIGRRWAYLLGYATLGVGGFLAPLSPNWSVYATSRVLLGAGVAGCCLSSYVWAVEMLDTSTRRVMSVLPSLAFSFGQITATPLAYAFPQWRDYLMCCQVVSLVGMTYWWFMRESPQWLASVERMQEAHEVLCAMARANGRKTLPPPPPAVSQCALADADIESVSTASTTGSPPTFGSLRDFCDRRLRVRIVVMCVNWFSVSFAFYGLSLFSPDLPFSIYTANVLSALVALPFYIMAPVLVNARWCGRKGALMGSYFLGGGLLMLSTRCTIQWLALMVYYAANGVLSLSFAVLYFWSVELFPTDIRARCMSIQSVCARIGAMLSPFIVDLGRTNTTLALCCFAVPCLFSGVLDILLPETRGKVLPATIDDLDDFSLLNAKSPMLREPLLKSAAIPHDDVAQQCIKAEDAE